MRMSTSHLLRILPIAMLAGHAVCGAAETTAGDDLRALFARAADGAPIRAAAIGGSITQAGGGWIEPWLSKTFPASLVVMRNAGMSATGSALGMFRIDRDVIATQPDLVLIEYAVNDGGGAEEDVVWTVESCVRRLKNLPRPPAIVMLEAASRQRPLDAIPPQRKVADHYGLLTVDLNKAVQEKLAAENLKWEDLLSDDVHPNAKGHTFYGERIGAALQPFVGPQKPAAPRPLPPPLSKRPLILDGALSSVPLGDGWTKEHALPAWWNMFFLGVTACKTGGNVLEIPFRGTVVGLFYALDESYGLLYAGVDGAKPHMLTCNNRKGYTYSLLANDLQAGEHVLRLVIPADAVAGGVKLGYVMTGGDTDAHPVAATRRGDYDAKKLAALCIGAVSNKAWAWVGPFGDVSKPWPASDTTLPNLQTVFWPEAAFSEGRPPMKATEEQAGAAAWQVLKDDSLVVDLAKLTGFKDRGVNYAWTVIESDGPVTLEGDLMIDYWGKIWVDGILAADIKEHSGGPVNPIPVKLPLRKGKNNVLVKVHSGSLGCMFSLRIPERPASVRFANPL